MSCNVTNTEETSIIHKEIGDRSQTHDHECTRQKKVNFA